MLKIKDNINLKELEKFGFKERKYTCNTGEVSYYMVDCEDGSWVFIENFGDDSPKGFIDMGLVKHNVKYNAMDTLFDLIQAGLVEKVENNG